MGTTEAQYTTATKLKRIAWLSQQNSEKKFECLMHLFNEESLKRCYYELSGSKAIGADGVTKAKYGEDLDTNLESLINRMKTMSYKPGSIKQVEIPKEGAAGKTRTLGISNFEDKLVQKMTQKILESIYEPLFKPCSYGFRPGIGCHDAIRAISKHLYNNRVEMVIDLDIENFFGSIDHKMAEEILRKKIKDEKFIRYIIRMFKSGILSNDELTVNEEGVVQGSCCSPIIANIVAHYAIDCWFEETVKTYCRGKVELLRYCDDVCILCEKAADAARIKDAIAKRLAKYGLKLNEGKTKCIPFLKSKKGNSFDFLGFCIYWGRSKKGYIIPMVKTSGKRMRSKLKRANQWARTIRNTLPLRQIWKLLRSKLEGHIRYFGVSFNLKRVGTFIYHVKRIMFKWLNRRSQRKSFTWEQFEKYEKLYQLPKVRICHTLF